MGVLNGTLHYDCATDLTTIHINTGPGTPAFVQKVLFKLDPSQSNRITMAPNSSADFLVAGKVDSLTVTRIDFYWKDAEGEHYAVHPDTTLTYTGSTECPVETTVPVVTTPKPPPSTTIFCGEDCVVTTTTAVDRCEEDEPCWDCNTMGNQICGSTTTASVVTLPPTGPNDHLTNTFQGTGLGLVAVGAVAVLISRIRRRFV